MAHGATCARCGQGGEDRQSPPGLASQWPGVNPKASVLWQPALVVAGLHTSRSVTVTVTASALESRPPGTGDKAHHRSHWSSLGLKKGGCKRATEGLRPFPGVLQSLGLSRNDFCSVLSSPLPSLFSVLPSQCLGLS